MSMRSVTTCFLLVNVDANLHEGIVNDDSSSRKDEVLVHKLFITQTLLDSKSISSTNECALL